MNFEDLRFRKNVAEKRDSNSNKMYGVDSLIRKMEKVELSMKEWNRGRVKFDPV